MMRLLAAWTALAAAAWQIGAAVPQSPADDPSLPRLEAALSSAPDDLRAGNEYRMAIIRTGQYDRALAFFEALTREQPDAANAHLNFGFAYVDKIPTAGSISQVILANKALTEFTRALELRPSWIGYYTRGNSYLYWPKIFDRTRLGIADLEEALRMQQADEKRAYHVRTFIALGDGHWIMDDAEKATAIWRAGLEQFPDNPALKARLAATASARKALINDTYDSSRRVDTNLEELWVR
jgi:tetratricopeptide (TPR) repeat protein